VRVIAVSGNYYLYYTSGHSEYGMEKIPCLTLTLSQDQMAASCVEEPSLRFALRRECSVVDSNHNF
jgi:hypothetical protein